MLSEEQISISKLHLDIAKERLSYADEILIVVCNEYNKLKNFCLGWSFDPGPPHQRGITPRQINTAYPYWDRRCFFMPLTAFPFGS